MPSTQLMSARRAPRYTLWVPAVLGAAFTFLVSACGSDSESITEARAKGTGAEITIEGFVSVPPAGLHGRRLCEDDREAN